MTVTVAMFRRVGIEIYLENTKSMFCTPGFIWGEWGYKAYKTRVTRKEATSRERKRMQFSCTYFGVTVVTFYLKQHMMRFNGICVSHKKGS